MNPERHRPLTAGRYPAQVNVTIKPSQPSLSVLNQLVSKDSSSTTELERENSHVRDFYGTEIKSYMKELELLQPSEHALLRHKVTPALRGRMVDWMIEVLTNFKCDDQTFFLACSLLDRYFKGKAETREVQDLHIIGVTCMFIASKYEDIYPLKMKMVYEKIAHKKLPIERIKALELDILRVIQYRIPAPCSFDFLKLYLKDVLDISVQKQSDKKKEPSLIERLSIYLAKMALHDYEICGKKPSIQAVGALYVSLKITEQLKKVSLITNELVVNLVKVSGATEEEIVDVSQRVLYLAQNFEKAFPGLENLKKTHFSSITSLL